LRDPRLTALFSMNIYFYDNFSSSYNRFGNPVTERLLKLNKDIRVFYIHDNYDNGIVTIQRQDANRLITIDKNEVITFVRKYPPHCFLSFSFRIPDVYWTLFFNNLLIPTYQVQHGLYVNNYKRSMAFLLLEIKRVFSYLHYLTRISKLVENKRQTLGSLIKKDVKIPIANSEIDEKIRSKNLIVWGEYWMTWFKNEHGYTDSTLFHICGSFDFALLNSPDNLIENDKSSITYICQTLVEDGRLNVKYFEVFISNLADLIERSKQTVYIKYHPRSDKNLYARLRGYKNVVFTTKYPFSKVYIGHYSSLLTVGSHMKKDIIFVEFPSHPTPPAFQHMTKNIIQYTDSIKVVDLVKNNFDPNYYYEYMEDPFGEIARILIAEL
jgi:hypothetical protein